MYSGLSNAKMIQVAMMVRVVLQNAREQKQATAKRNVKKENENRVPIVIHVVMMKRYALMKYVMKYDEAMKYDEVMKYDEAMKREIVGRGGGC